MDEKVKLEYENILSYIFGEFYNLFPKARNLEVEFHFVESLSDEYIKIRPDKKNDIISNKEDIDILNGLLATPRFLYEKIHILINLKKVIQYTEDNSMTWIGTIAHELTHAMDYYSLAKSEGLTEYLDFDIIGKYYVFQLWSEYHARKVGYSILRNYFRINDLLGTQEEQIKYIMNKEWPYHKNSHYIQYHQNTEDGNKQLYITMQLLGRYSVWCDEYPDFFNEKNLKEDFYGTEWMYHIFVFLRSHEVFEDIYSNLEHFKSILRENWENL